MGWLTKFLGLLILLGEIGAEISDRVGQFLRDLVRSGGRPVAVVNAITTFLSAIAGIIVGKLATWRFAVVAQLLEKQKSQTAEELMEDVGKPYQHVMTPAQAVYWFQAVFERTLKTISGTSEQTILDIIISAIARSVFRMITGSGFLSQIWKILKIKDEAAAVRWFADKVQRFKDNAVVLATLAAIVAFFMLCVHVASHVFFWGALFIAPREWENHVLFPSNPREKQKVRISRRLGGVRP